MKNEIDIGTVQRCVESVSKTESVIGKTGASAYFRCVIGQQAQMILSFDFARREVAKALSDFVVLHRNDEEYTTRLAQAIMLSRDLAVEVEAWHEVEMIDMNFADIIQEAGSESRKNKDRHGSLAEYIDDFKPSGQNDFEEE